MANDYSTVGLRINCIEDLYEFANRWMDKASFATTEHGEFAILKMGDKIELWIYGDENGVYPEASELVYKTMHYWENIECRWIDYPEGRNDSGMMECWIKGGEEEFPLCIDVEDAFTVEKKDENGNEINRCVIDFALFARDINIFKDEDDYLNSGKRSIMAPESCIPCGTFSPKENDENFKPNATAMINGIVQTAVKLENPLTGGKFWEVEINCLGYKFVAVIAEELVQDEIAPGNVIAGVYWLSGVVYDTEWEAEDGDE